MSSIVFKLGRWTMIGALAVASAAACGGRGNLPTSGGDDDDDDTTFGGTFSGSGGSRAGSGGSRAGSGGKVSTGGNVGTSGSIGTSGNVTGGFGGGFACLPGAQLCDPPGQVLLTCLDDGSGYKGLDCRARGQQCSNGACRDLVCTPNQPFCAGNALRVCSANGADSVVKQICNNGSFCDVKSLSCQPGVCAPNAPVCNGDIATQCNGNGSGILGGGVDCSLSGRRCDEGQCVCGPNTADCDNVTQNGCEITLTSDPDNCGGCGLSCSGSHQASRTCNDGNCAGACQDGFDDCNGDQRSDGCETRVDNDVKSCGGCGAVCSANHVTQSCVGGVCNGACSANFFDCNGDKQADGCEADSRSDPDNCGACGTKCSTSHIARSCSAGKCSGMCNTGFADCNANKQKDGCEVDTRADKLNCGGCGKACKAGQSCSNGVCSGLFTFSGVKQNVPAASLKGWTECFSDPYGDQQTLSTVLANCTGSQLLMACRKAGSDTLLIAAHAPRADVLFDTGTADVTHDANGVAWYFDQSQSWGFAPAGDAVHRFTCDITDSTLQLDGVDGDKRLCWHTSNDILSSGWRCGRSDSLNSDFSFERVLFQAP